ncbi:MAG: metal ABC transporter ATP-binding protein [Caldimicrobium sp.]
MIIEIKDLSLYLNGKIILEDINLQVQRGDFLALIGPNGGGKSTLIRCLLGFIKPQRGKIFLFGKDLTKFREWYKIGYLPQRAGKEINSLLPLTVEEFIFLPSKWYMISPDSEYISHLMNMFGIKDILEKKLSQLSFGQFQRAYLVRALLLKPELVILDEPSVGLDFISQETFYQILSSLHKQGLTIVLITHETWLISKEVTKIACLNQRLYYHGEHKEFCVLAERGIPGFSYHRIEHTHW